MPLSPEPKHTISIVLGIAGAELPWGEHFAAAGLMRIALLDLYPTTTTRVLELFPAAETAHYGQPKSAFWCCRRSIESIKMALAACALQKADRSSSMDAAILHALNSNSSSVDLTVQHTQRLKLSNPTPRAYTGTRTCQHEEEETGARRPPPAGASPSHIRGSLARWTRASTVVRGGASPFGRKPLPRRAKASRRRTRCSCWGHWSWRGSRSTRCSRPRRRCGGIGSWRSSWSRSARCVRASMRACVRAAGV